MFYRRKKKDKPFPIFDKSGVKVKKKTDYKKKLDEVFSQYIRLKHSDDRGYCRCISCGRIHFWKDIQNGHYMSRRYLSTRFHENNCRPQCVSCNIFNQGNVQMYRRGLIAEIGEDAVDLIEVRAKTITGHYTDFEYQELCKYYKTLVTKMKKEKGL